MATRLIAALNDLHKGREEFPELLAKYRTVVWIDKDDENDHGEDVNLGTDNAESQRALMESLDKDEAHKFYAELVQSQADELEVQLKSQEQFLEHATNVREESIAMQKHCQKMNAQCEKELDLEFESERATAATAAAAENENVNERATADPAAAAENQIARRRRRAKRKLVRL